MKWIIAKNELPNESERVLLFTPYPVLGDEHTFVGNKDLYGQNKEETGPDFHPLDATPSRTGAELMIPACIKSD